MDAWRHGEWFFNALVEKAQKKKTFERKKSQDSRYVLADFDVRTRGDLIESYNKMTNEVFASYPNEAFAETEAWRDLREEFME